MTAISPPWPPSIVTMDFGLESNTGRFESPLTRATQSTARIGARWGATVSLAYLDEFDALRWKAFLAKVQDRALTFAWNEYPLSRPQSYPLGVSDGITCDETSPTCDSTTVTVDAALSYGEPVVDGADQTGRTLSMSGWDAGAALYAGEYLSFDNGSYRELHMLEDDATASAAGVMVASIVPPIRISPEDGVPIQIDGQAAGLVHRCYGDFILVAQRSAKWDLSEHKVAFQFTCIEPLRVAA